MQLITRPTTLENSRIVGMRMIRLLHSIFGPTCCYFWSSNMWLVSKNLRSCLRNWLQIVVVFLRSLKLEPTISSLGMTGGPLYEDAAFHWDGCFFNHGLLSVVMVIVLWLDSRKEPWQREDSSQEGIRFASSATNCSKSSI